MLNKKLREVFGKKKDGNKIFTRNNLIVPVYNSEDTLEKCLDAIRSSNYPNRLIDILLINNESTDNSFSVYTEYQSRAKDMSITWLNSGQGRRSAEYGTV